MFLFHDYKLSNVGIKDHFHAVKNPTMGCYQTFITTYFKIHWPNVSEYANSLESVFDAIRVIFPCTIPEPEKKYIYSNIQPLTHFSRWQTHSDFSKQTDICLQAPNTVYEYLQYWKKDPSCEIAWDFAEIVKSATEWGKVLDYLSWGKKYLITSAEVKSGTIMCFLTAGYPP